MSEAGREPTGLGMVLGGQQKLCPWVLGLLKSLPASCCPSGHSLTKLGGCGVVGGPWMSPYHTHSSKGCSKGSDFAPWQGCPHAKGRIAAIRGCSSHAMAGVRGTDTPCLALCVPWAGSSGVALQAAEASSQDEGSQPEDGQQVRGQGAPSAEPWQSWAVRPHQSLPSQWIQAQTDPDGADWGPGLCWPRRTNPTPGELPVRAGVPHSS